MSEIEDMVETFQRTKRYLDRYMRPRLTKLASVGEFWVASDDESACNLFSPIDEENVWVVDSNDSYLEPISVSYKLIFSMSDEEFDAYITNIQERQKVDERETLETHLRRAQETIKACEAALAKLGD